MIKRVEELLEGKGGSYIFPFFWQHGESEEVLREYMKVIYESHIQEVCVECRPHPDFCGPKWWHDMDIIMDEARKRHMRVWLLDDSHFPTGYANGGYEEAEPQFCKQYLNFAIADVDGPTPQIRWDIKKEMEFLKKPAPGPFPPMDPEVAEQMGIHIPKERTFDDDKLHSVIAYKVVRGGFLGEAVNITNYVEDGILTWDVPEGMWRIYAAYVTHNCGGESDYMNVISAPSVRVLIDQIYEPHFQRYGADFGKTFAGFFSDEPMVGNKQMNYDPDSLIGTVRMALPWNEEVEEMLCQALGKEFMNEMPILWNHSWDSSKNAEVRFAYMDAVTKLIREHFSCQIGNWCHAHGVEYIGHLVEDMNSSAKLGLSLGNYYRAQAGQDMAGIDVIGGGVLLSGEDRIADGDYYPDGEFYHFYLGKLGSGLAHTDPKKKGRTMCELYGAYGWDFGVRSMKYLTDHMLLRGVNRFVPHAFSPKAFPDQDCPPHFYANGENAQYAYFGKLMEYTQRVCHLLDGGVHIPQVALLHCDEAMWMGTCMLPQKAARELMEHQIDFDVIMQDIFVEEKYTLDSKLHIHGESYSALIIPRYPYLTAGVAAFVRKAHDKGFPVIFVDALPDGIVGEESVDLFGEVVGLENLSSTLKAKGIEDICVNPSCEKIRYYHYRQEKDIYLLSNEATGSIYKGEVFIPVEEDVCVYDAQNNVLCSLEFEKVSGGVRIPLTLYPFEPKILIFGSKGGERDFREKLSLLDEKILLENWDVSLCECKEYPAFGDSFAMEKTVNIGNLYPDFSGFIRYEKKVFLSQKKSVVLEIENAYECVSVWCNEKLAGMAYHPRYLFDLTELMKEGENKIRIEVATTPDRKVRTILGDGGFRRCPQAMDPIGIVGEVAIYLQ